MKVSHNFESGPTKFSKFHREPEIYAKLLIAMQLQLKFELHFDILKQQ
jgi:hypothetical protein